MARAAGIKALLKKANEDFIKLRGEYESSLSEQKVREDLKVSIKNIFENLRSCLDYLAHDIFEGYCPAVRKPDRLYFPIRSTQSDFKSAIAKNYPDLQRTRDRSRRLRPGDQPAEVSISDRRYRRTASFLVKWKCTSFAS